MRCRSRSQLARNCALSDVGSSARQSRPAHDEVSAKAQAALDEAQQALNELESFRRQIEAQSLASARADITALLGLRVEQLRSDSVEGVEAAPDRVGAAK